MSEEILKSVKELGTQVEAKYEKIKSELLERIEKSEKQAKDSTDGIDAALKTEIKTLSEDFVELKKQLGNVTATAAPQFKSESEATVAYIAKAMEENADKVKNQERFRIHTKAAGATMSSTTNLTGTNFVEPQVVAPWYQNRYESAHIRNIIPVQSLGTSDKVAYTQFASQNSNVDKVAEGALKPLSDVSFEKKIVMAQKIAHHYRVPEEMLDDNVQLATAITFIGMEELKKKEDYFLLYQNGAGLEFDGLTVSAQAFSDPTSTDLTQRYDVLVAAVTQARLAKHRPNFILLNPADVADMILAKDNSGQYLFPDLVRTGSPNVLNVPIITHSDITAGTFLMGDSNGALIWDRKGAEVRFFEQDQDNAVKNLVTIVIEERLTMQVHYPQAFVTGTFATIITNA